MPAPIHRSPPPAEQPRGWRERADPAAPLAGRARRMPGRRRGRSPRL